jgi:transcriptional regulator with XRE-family HTH domain
MDSQAFGHRLKVLMADRGVNVSELAEMTGVSRQTISSYLNSGALPALDTSLKLSKVLDVTIDQLVSAPLEQIIDR